jgi:CDP-diacylglycerol--glycerol-3-phosphate 3-phosphatidyltransferase
MANLITLGRIILLFFTVALIYVRQPWAIFLAAFLTLVVFVSDALDGYVARRRGRADTAGAVFDIAGDRVVENVYWLVCAHLGLVSIWAGIIMLTRSFAVDAMRSLALAEGKTAFGDKTMMQSRLGLWLSASRLHRALYGGAKVVAFVYLIGEYGLRVWAEQDPARFAGWSDTWPVLSTIGQVLAWFAVFYGVVRGAVVVYDARGYYLSPRRKGAS